jgi:hypothetical protein
VVVVSARGCACRQAALVVLSVIMLPGTSQRAHEVSCLLKVQNVMEMYSSSLRETRAPTIRMRLFDPPNTIRNACIPTEEDCARRPHTWEIPIGLHRLNVTRARGRPEPRQLSQPHAGTVPEIPSAERKKCFSSQRERVY